jgi:hypothetical protein
VDVSPPPQAARDRSRGLICGKGGVIKAITERVCPRVFRVIALPAPGEREKSQADAAAPLMPKGRYIRHRELAAARLCAAVGQADAGVTPLRPAPRATRSGFRP